MASINNQCFICKGELNSVGPFLEGHRTKKKNLHVYDPGCLLEWLKTNSFCPICKQVLKQRHIIKVENPHHVWYRHAIKRITPFIKLNLPTACVVVGYKIVTNSLSALKSNFFQAMSRGSTGIIVSSLTTAVPMVLKKMNIYQIKKVDERIVMILVASPAFYALFSPMEDLTTVVGTIAGSALGFGVNLMFENNFPEREVNQIILSNQNNVKALGFLSFVASLIVGLTAGGKFGYKQCQNIYASPLSAVAGSVVGVVGSYVLSFATIFPVLVIKHPGIGFNKLKNKIKWV